MSTEATPQDLEQVEKLRRAYAAVKDEIRKVIVGQDHVVDELFMALFCRGHCLLVGVPGLAKTLVISTLSRVLSLGFSRIQFTPDLMPSDITGTEIIQEDKASGRREFKFLPGPIFSNVILADEINRTPPKTQAALLEAMQEYQVTVAGRRHELQKPFFVLATQNPIEQEGTYPLPEAQLDRFMFLVDVGYPSFEEEVRVVRSTTGPVPAPLHKVLGPAQILAMQELVLRVPVSDETIQYAVSLARRTRPKEGDAPELVRKYVSYGAGPRASQFLIVAAKARAVLHGRFAAEIDDVKAMARPVLVHRVLPNFTAEAEGMDAGRIVDHVLQSAGR